MKILVFDIGGTAIKYGICQDGHLMETSECPTEAYKGGPHILETICTLAEQSLPFDAIGISTAGQVNPEEGYIIYANSNIPSIQLIIVILNLSFLFCYIAFYLRMVKFCLRMIIHQ